MNRVVITGRLTRDPETKTTQSDATVTRFGVAVDRRFKREGEPTADFFNCVAFGKTAEFVEKYFKKGMKIDLTGRIQTGSYTNKDGQKVNTFDIVVEECEFGESKAASENGRTSAPPPMAPSPVPTPQTPPPVYNAPPMPQQQAPQPQYQQQYVQQPQYQQQYAPQQFYQQQQQQPLPDFVTVPPNSPDEIPFP